MLRINNYAYYTGRTMYDIILVRPAVFPQDEQMLMMFALSNLKKSEPKRAPTALRFIEPASGPCNY